VPAHVDLDRAASWAFISEATRAKALGTVGLERTRVIHAGIDRGLFDERAEHGWDGRLLYVGRIDARKGIETAIRALAGLPEATLTVDGAGDGRELARLRGLAEALGLRDRVRFRRSARADLPGRYADADVVLFPVLWEEPWGLVPLEAMAVGTPVIATGIGGSREYLRDQENCLLFEPRDDPAGLAAAVGRLAGDRSLRRRLRRRGLETAAAFDQSRFCAEVAELIDSTLASPR
jgi:glycosyltransferase involved in cell wall biosynthesis